MAGEILRILNGSGAGSQIPLQGDFIVGRFETGMGNLAGDSEISRRHARFQQTADGQVIVEDLGSTNGTHVNGQLLGGPHVLAPGDQITLGKTILEFDGGAQAPVAAAVPPAAAAVSAPPPPRPQVPASGALGDAGAYGGQGFAGGPISGATGRAPRSSRPRWLPALAVAVAALIVAGAVVAVITNSGSDTGKPAAQAQSAPAQSPSVRSVPALEARLKSLLNGASSSGPRVTADTCPGNAPAAAGATFACQVQGQQGLSGTVTVTLKDARRKAYSYKAALQGNGFTRTASGTVS